MKRQPVIPRANTSKGKAHTYRQNIQRFNTAMRHGFHYEALLIDGALIEDRLRSLLYHVGLYADRDATRLDRRAKEQLRALRDKYTEPKKTFAVNNLGDKILVMKAILLWHQTVKPTTLDDLYLQSLWKQCERRLDDTTCLLTLEGIDTWREYRNEIVHALLNKNQVSVDSTIAEKCSEGFELFRQLDVYVDQIKYRNAIRKSLGLTTTGRH